MTPPTHTHRASWTGSIDDVLDVLEAPCTCDRPGARAPCCAAHFVLHFVLCCMAPHVRTAGSEFTFERYEAWQYAGLYPPPSEALKVLYRRVGGWQAGSAAVGWVNAGSGPACLPPWYIQSHSHYKCATHFAHYICTPAHQLPHVVELDAPMRHRPLWPTSCGARSPLL